MLTFLLKRLGQGFITLIGVTIIVFLLVKALPGDPLEIRAGERGLTPERHAELSAQYGFDKPLYIQYFRYLKDLSHGNFGTSFKSYEPVVSEFFARFPATIELTVVAMFFAIFCGIPAGIWAAMRRGKLPDQAVMGLSLAGYSMPIFWWALMLVYVFSLKLNIFPVSGRISEAYWVDNVTGFMLIDSILSGEKGAFIDTLWHFILPAMVLGTIPLAYIARMTRSSMLEVLGEDYIRTARAKGLTPYRVIVTHALRNALIPVITIIGFQISVLLSGAILTETIFAWPGIGKWVFEGFSRRDYPVIQGGILLVAIVVISINIIVDLLYAWANPAMRKK
ncbi:MAG: ABC transporter permease subunit [Alphaproteobacteria bacterium]